LLNLYIYLKDMQVKQKASINVKTKQFSPGKYYVTDLP